MNKIIFKKSGLLVILAAVLLTIQSCVKDFTNHKFEAITYSPSVAIPLVYSSLSIADLLTKGNTSGLVVVDDSNFCTIVYKNSLLSLRADSLIKLPNQQFPSYSAGLTPAEIAALGSAGIVTASYSQTVNFNSGSGTTFIDSLTLKACNLNLTLNSQFPYNGQIVISIPAAKKNGVAFSQILPFKYTGSLPVVVNANYNLAGYDVDMTVGGTTSNQFVVNYSVTLTGGGAPPPATDSISISGSLNTIQFLKIFGDVGQLSLFPPTNKDTIAVTIFQNSLGSGVFSIVNPSLKVTISNSYGVPISATLPLLEAFNPPGSNFPLTGVPNPLPILSPGFNQIGQVLADSFTLNKGNSNIATVINNDPKFFIYSGTGTSNPAGATHANFVLDSSRCKIAIEADLPLYGTASNFVLQDTIQFSPGSFVTSNVQSALFQIYTSNGMPIDVNMQIYFTDSLYHKLDSLVIPNQLIIRSGVLNAAGIVIAPTQYTYRTTLTKARLAKLGNATHLLIKDVESTTNKGATNVKIYSNYRIDLKLGMEVLLQVQQKL